MQNSRKKGKEFPHEYGADLPASIDPFVAHSHPSCSDTHARVALSPTFARTAAKYLPAVFYDMHRTCQEIPKVPITPLSRGAAGCCEQTARQALPGRARVRAPWEGQELKPGPDFEGRGWEARE